MSSRLQLLFDAAHAPQGYISPSTFNHNMTTIYSFDRITIDGNFSIHSGQRIQPAWTRAAAIHKPDPGHANVKSYFTSK